MIIDCKVGVIKLNELLPSSWRQICNVKILEFHNGAILKRFKIQWRKCGHKIHGFLTTTWYYYKDAHGTRILTSMISNSHKCGHKYMAYWAFTSYMPKKSLNFSKVSWKNTQKIYMANSFHLLSQSTVILSKLKEKEKKKKTGQFFMIEPGKKYVFIRYIMRLKMEINYSEDVFTRYILRIHA